MLINKIYNKVINSVYKYRVNNIKLAKRGSNVSISLGFNFNRPENIEIDDYVYIGPYATIYAHGRVKIGRGSIIGPKLTIYTANHNFKSGSEALPYDHKLNIQSVDISENVWIGGNVILLPGAKLGEGVIVGAGTVISKEIPAYSIVVGNPCKIIGTRDVKDYKRLKSEDAIYLIEKAKKDAKKI